ncbi:MAG: glycosyltransferase involved in cell wall biosynthesis [Parasphingorhabdus sp.]|jgi:glycosyltransferase involved in cell wall biosynthesis
MPSPLVSIGLPVFNGEEYLATAIQSILCQTLNDFELVVMDNASTDSSAGIATEIAQRDKRVKVLSWNKNVGAAANFNKVFEISKGKYFKWAAHDDVLHENFLEYCEAFLSANRHYVLVHSNTARIDNLGQVVGEYSNEPDLDDHDPCQRFAKVINSNYFCVSIFGLIRRSNLRRTPLIGAYVGSDRNLLAELALMGKIKQLQHTLFERRDHPNCSIRKFQNEKERLHWFNPVLSAAGYRPTSRRVVEYQKSIERVPLTERHRLCCRQALQKWCETGYHHSGQRVAKLLAAETAMSQKLSNPKINL